MEASNEELTWDSNLKFEIREEFVNMVRSFYSRQGYVLSIYGSRKDKYVILRCDRGGCYRDRSLTPLLENKKKTSSRLINCPFEVKGKKLDGFWSLHVTNSTHNHEPSTDLSGHPISRRLSKENMRHIDEMSKSGIAPRQILSSLRKKDPQLQMVSRTIYHAKGKLYRENLVGRTPIQALFDELGQGGFEYNIACDENGRLTHLFFAHPLSITLSKMYSSVFVMDCTYKTNKYKMPLLDIVGVSSFNSSFYACFAFLQKEGEEDYIWALQNFSEILGQECQPLVVVYDRELGLMNAIRFVFPNAANMLCVWHINKNILANCKHHFERQVDWEMFLATWNGVVFSTDEYSFEESWQMWTNRYLHLGNLASSRAEGAHGKLKKYLQVSTSDLRTVKDRICLAIKNEFEEIKTQLSSERLRILHVSNINFFKEVQAHVSMFAMKELIKQFDMMRLGKMKSTCTGQFISTMGLPCSHVMLSYKNGVLPLSSINSHWRIDTKSLSSSDLEKVDDNVEFQQLLNELQGQYSQWPLDQKEVARKKISDIVGTSSSQLLSGPSVQIPKGRPSKKRKESSSTRRDLSQFEVVEATRRCRRCNGIGHNSRTCPKNHPAYAEERDYTMDTFDLNVIPSD